MRRILALLALAASFSPSARADTLYADLGGGPGIDRIAAGAGGLYMTDPALHPYFDDINPGWLTLHFATFVCRVAGGPCVYRGRDMAASHRGLHIDERAFDRVVEDLQTAMTRAGVPFWTENRLLARLAPMERQIVTR